VLRVLGDRGERARVTGELVEPLESRDGLAALVELRARV